MCPAAQEGKLIGGQESGAWKKVAQEGMRVQTGELLEEEREFKEVRYHNLRILLREVYLILRDFV